MKIGLALTGYKGLSYLKRLTEQTDMEIVWVKTYGDFSNEIEKLSPKNIDKIEDNLEEVDKVIFVGWQYIVKPHDKYIIFHDSLLPKYKGFAPTVNALINGERFLGVTAFKPTEKIDDGFILGQKEIPIPEFISIQYAFDLISDAYFDLTEQVCLAVPNYLQPKEPESFSIWRDKIDYTIRWTWNASKILRFILATGYPYDGAVTWAPHRIVIKKAKLVSMNFIDSMDHAGKIFQLNDNQPIVVCGSGALQILEYTGIKITKTRTRLGQDNETSCSN